jgi:hypothetical protein
MLHSVAPPPALRLRVPAVRAKKIRLGNLERGEHFVTALTRVDGLVLDKTYYWGSSNGSVIHVELMGRGERYLHPDVVVCLPQ